MSSGVLIDFRDDEGLKKENLMLLNHEAIGNHEEVSSNSGGNGEVIISERIVSLRKERGLTLQACAKLSQVAASTLSKIERGELSPTVSTLQKIATGFGLEVTDLLTKGRTSTVGLGRRAFSRAGEGKSHVSLSCANNLLCHELKNKRMVPIRTIVTARNTEEYPVWPHSDVEIFLWVVKGQMQLHTRIYEPLELAPGDSVYYDANGEHCWTSTGDEDAEVIWVMTT